MRLRPVRSNVRAGSPPHAPKRSARLFESLARRASRLRGLESVERQSLLRGLLFLALVIFLVVLWKSGSDRAFAPAWWQQ